MIVHNLRSIYLENYQAKREKVGKAPATIGMELFIARTMINKAFDNDLVGGSTVKAFRI